MNESVNLIM